MSIMSAVFNKITIVDYSLLIRILSLSKGVQASVDFLLFEVTFSQGDLAQLIAIKNNVHFMLEMAFGPDEKYITLPVSRSTFQ